ncbi:MAG: hypothetical protein JNM85_10560 [Chthonomonas sp.]|nr:hypothetical protein [Chthonomonas sp.]
MPIMGSLSEFLASQVEANAARYADDLEAMDESILLGSVPHGRAPVDFTHEVAVVNRRVASRLAGVDPGPWPFESWCVAPDESRSKSALLAELRESAASVCDALRGKSDEMLWGGIELPNGDTVNGVTAATLCANHMAYHDGQLNLLQAQADDMEMHWQQ